MGMRTIHILVIGLVIFLVGPVGAGADDGDGITIRGSHALFLTLQSHIPALEQAVETKLDFSKAGGCGDAAKSVAEGNSGGICCLFDDEELARLGGAVIHPLAFEPLMIVVNKKNPVTDLSTAQVRQILSGKIKNWQEVGGPDLKIVVVMRPHCGPRPGHWKTIMPLAQWKPGIKVNKFLTMITTVAKLPGAIGHLGTVLYDPGKMNIIRVDGIDPLDSDAMNRHYPFYRTVSLLTGAEPNAIEKRLVNFLRSDAAKSIFAAKHLITTRRATPPKLANTALSAEF